MCSHSRLYRRSKKLTINALVTVAMLSGVMPAQGRQRKAPRAIAVVQWQTNAQGKAVPRLIPVTVLDEGKYYDGGVYRAAPEPMALESGTVYEAQDKGELLGYFTLKRALHDDANLAWVGLGAWQSAAPKMEDRAEPNF